MEKLPWELGMLPESLRNLLQNIDPSTLEQLRASIDPAAVAGFLSNAMDFMRQSLDEKDSQALNQLLASWMQLINQQGKS